MAASEPAANVHNWSEVEGHSYSNHGADTSSLELGMTNMTLATNDNYYHPQHDHDRFRADAESTFEPNDNELASAGYHRPIAASQAANVLDPAIIRVPSAPASPSSDRQLKVSRPPGLSSAIHVPSPIGKPGHSKNTSATSPLLTLTPNSSVDGNDWNSLGGGARQSPSFVAGTGDAPTMPFLPPPSIPPEHRRRGSDRGDGVGGGGGSSVGTGGFGSFDLADGDNDGLLGLGALRDRANSSPGPVPILSTSPPVGVSPRGGGGHFLAHPHHQHHHQSQLQPPPGNHGYGLPHDVPASRPRDRPPLSHAYQDGMSSMGSGMGFVSVSSNRSLSGDMNNTSMDSSDSRGFGAIGRPPDFRQVVSGGDFDPNRRRSASTGDSFHAQYAIQNGVPDAAVSHKFGTLPTLGAHIQQQRMPDGIPLELHRPRHVRSVSQPMPNNGSQYVPAPGMDPRYGNAAVLHEGHSYPGENRYKPANSASNPASSPYLEWGTQLHYASQKRTSLPNFGGVAQGYIAAPPPSYSHAPPPRRENVEYHANPHGSVATVDDPRSYPSMISPGHSPMQVHYAASGSHSRHNSDAGSSTHLSSSPRSIGAASLPGNMMHHRRQMSGGGDDDFAHPLLGEHIDVPAEHDELYNAYSLAQSAQRHAHSLSLGELPSQYVEVSHHLPTAGAGLPMPKVVYSVKFKRTQRNFVLGPRISRDLKIGTYVKVEADRGEDLGIVVGKLPADKYSFSRSSFSPGLGPPGIGAGSGDLKRIIRLATHDEVSLLAMKRDEEEELLKVCRAKVRQRGLPMHVVDAEYQFDRHKLTFFFEAEGRVDFRELVRDLFSMYKTRIWMQQLDKNTANPSQAMISPHLSTLQMDYGTPIIAPVSEFADSIVLSGMSLGEGR